METKTDPTETILDHLDDNFNEDDYNLFEEESSYFEIEIEYRNLLLRIAGVETCNFFAEDGGDWGEVIKGCTNKSLFIDTVELYESGNYIHTGKDFKNELSYTLNSKI